MWHIDPATTRVEFAIRQQWFQVAQATTRARFSDVSGVVRITQGTSDAVAVNVTIAVATIDTGTARRDAHLLRSEFFDAQQHPTIAFTVRKLEAVDEASGSYRAVGDLTIRGRTHRVVLAVTDLRIDGDGLHLTATATLDRQMFGISGKSTLSHVAHLLGASRLANLVDVSVVLEARRVDHAAAA